MGASSGAMGALVVDPAPVAPVAPIALVALVTAPGNGLGTAPVVAQAPDPTAATAIIIRRLTCPGRVRSPVMMAVAAVGSGACATTGAVARAVGRRRAQVRQVQSVLRVQQVRGCSQPTHPSHPMTHPIAPVAPDLLAHRGGSQPLRSLRWGSAACLPVCKVGIPAVRLQRPRAVRLRAIRYRRPARRRAAV